MAMVCCDDLMGTGTRTGPMNFRDESKSALDSVFANSQGGS